MKLGISIALLFSFLSSFSQPYGNEWINYNQNYYDFKVHEKGIYRINFQDLTSANVPLASLDPRNIQIFARGKEIPIFVAGEQDGTFNANDYIEFFATGNDGWLDSVLHKGRDKQANPYYSLITDTISYYLTWNSSTSNLRIQEENAIDFGNYFAAQFLWKESLNVFDDAYYDGATMSGGATDPEYVDTEGWMSQVLNSGNKKNYSISTTNRFNSGPFAELEFILTGQSNYQLNSNGDHHILWKFGGLEEDIVFDGYQLIKRQKNFSPSQIVGGNNTFSVESIDDLGSPVDRSAISYIKVTYPHTMSLRNASEFEFLIDDHNNQDAQYLEFLFFNGGNQPILYDLDNAKRVRVIKTLNSYRSLIPNGGGRKRCYIAASANLKSVRLKAVGTNAQFLDFAIDIPDSADFLISNQALWPELTRYAAYRTSTGRNPYLIDVEELYHQFSYGIEKHPLSIRNFIDYALSSLTAEPQSLFLVGKSINAKQHRKNALAYEQNLVPTIGNPAVDNLFSSGLNGGVLETAIPQGRLSASSLFELGSYLNKVIEFENAPTAKWMKRGLHFAGGLSLGETQRFENYLKSYNNELNSAPFGGTSLLFKKSTSVPIQTTLSDSIRTEINEGASIMTFFGHAAATGGFDISIDSPGKLDNRGRYPLILANSCFTGNFHQYNAKSTAEDYVLERNKGAIAFLASGNLGFEYSLNQYSSAFYENFARKNYDKSIAENMRQSVRDIQGSNPAGSLRLVCLEMAMQGDPLLKLNAHEIADYAISSSAYTIDPKEITSELDSFLLTFYPNNIGRETNDSILVQLERKFPIGQSDTSYLIRIPPIGFESAIQFKLPVDALKGSGSNNFSFILDPQNEFTEQSENNNRLDFEVLIRSGEVIPIYPYHEAIVGKTNIKLLASSVFALEPISNYQWEIDTSGFFNSPTLETKTESISGGVLEWEPTLLQNMRDSLVYYWRISKVPAPGENPNWRTSSFQYIPNESGWSQAHYHQQAENSLLFIEANDQSQQFDFVDNVKELAVFNQGKPSTAQLNNIRYAVDSDTRERNACGSSPGFLIAILDSLSLDSWQTPYGNMHQQNYFGQANADNYCFPSRTRSERYFLFRASRADQMLAMRDFLNTSVPDGSYVVLYTWLGVNYSSIWNQDSSILRSIENLGSQLIPNLGDSIPFIFTTQKGNSSSTQEIAGATTSSTIELVRVLTTNADFGTSISKEIPSSNSWQRLSYRFNSLETNSSDSVELDLIAVEMDGSERLLDRYYGPELDSSIASLANNQNFRGLRLKYKGEDISTQTPPQLQYWQLTHQELPDIAVAPKLYYEINSDTLQEGDSIKIGIAVINTSEQFMDSIELRASVLNSNNQIKLFSFGKIAGINANESRNLNVSFSSIGLRGRNEVILELNPNNLPREQYQFNNKLQTQVVVLGDRLNPIMEVTFDGRRIINRELVSSEPEIIIRLDDENQFLAIDDTSSFSIFLRAPGEAEVLQNFGSGTSVTMNFIPAKLPENQAIVSFQPSLKKDGIYRLRVQTADKSGNSSGSQDYEIEFEVVTESSITQFVNYPNPFSTSTRFVFTLTGSEIPDQVQIQILTVTGKVIKEIDQHEIGPIHIGNNISDYAWDGKDDFGDQLANGVYLYRVRVKYKGSNVKHRDSRLDDFFTKGFGKMYLLR